MTARSTLTRTPHSARWRAMPRWYRGATTVGELTGWAVPAILTGLPPLPTRLPTAQHHPNNLFTYLGSAYHYEVVEPITHLCPDRLCPPRATSLAAQVSGMVADSSIIYLHAELPAGLRTRLPALTDNWKGFIAATHWQRRWIGREPERSPTRTVGIHRRD